MRKCSKCHQTKEDHLFSVNPSSPDGLMSYCNVCKRKTANWNYWRYGITTEEIKLKLVQQNNQCAICKCIFDSINIPCIDHNHKTELNRGLLCKPCNLALGYLKEDIHIVENVILYLKFWKLQKPLLKQLLRAH